MPNIKPPAGPGRKSKRSKAKADVKKQASSRSATGRFLPGVSGNPAGKPKGSRNATTLLVEQLLEGQAEALTQRLIRKALSGSVHALELVFARLSPVRRDRQIEIELPKLDTLADLVAAHGKILEAVGAGEISPGEAREVAQLIDLRRRAVESVELLQRIESLEARLGEGGHGYAH